MGCTHCINDAKPVERHMTENTLTNVLNFIKVEKIYHHLIISGGEPTEHPDFVNMITKIIDFSKSFDEPTEIVITTNGFWILDNIDTAKQIINMKNDNTDVLFQVSTDIRYYPKKLNTTKRI